MKQFYYAACSLLLALTFSTPLHLRAQNHLWEPLNGPYGAPSEAITRTAAGTLYILSMSTKSPADSRHAISNAKLSHLAVIDVQEKLCSAMAPEAMPAVLKNCAILL